MAESPAVTIAPCRIDDVAVLVAGWHATNIATYPYVAEHQRHSLADADAFFRDMVLPRCLVLVARRAEQPVGLLALEAPWIRQFAVFAPWQRQGIGGALLQAARTSSPELRLFTYQRNTPARRFYEKHGFVAVGFGISPPPEDEPDVEYRWQAGPARPGPPARGGIG